MNQSTVNSLPVSEVPVFPASGKDIPAPKDSLFLYFLPPLLLLRLSRFVFHPNLKSKFMVTHTYLTHPLASLKQC